MFELIELALLIAHGSQGHNPAPLVLGLVVLMLLFAFEIAEHAVLERDRELSQEILEWLLPHVPPQVPGYEIAFSSRLANHIGADYYNVFPRWGRSGSAEVDRVFLVMADVAGTGLQGALLMATFQASLRVLADANEPLRDLAYQLNQWCWDRSLEGRHFTMAFFADLDQRSGALSYVSAGHQPPVISRLGGSLERLEQAGFPFGALADSEYEVGSAVLAPGDALVIFCDGVTAAVNRQGETFGEPRVMNTLRMASSRSAHDMLDMLHRSMLMFCGTVRQTDDLSVMVVRRLKAGAD